MFLEFKTWIDCHGFCKASQKRIILNNQIVENNASTENVAIRRLNFKNSSLAFTLAEVLITLGIIGIVAAMTIPTLTKNIQDQQNKTAFKKAYSNIAQVVQHAASDNGGSIEGAFGGTNNSFKNFFSPYLRTTKSCNYGDSSCWVCNGTRANDYFLNKKDVVTDWGGWFYLSGPTVMLQDGTLAQFYIVSEDCTGSALTPSLAPYTGTACGAIFVDVNGCKLPNTWGRDIFYIAIRKNSVFPMGPSASTKGPCNRSSPHAGMQCAEFVIQDKNY